MMTTITMMTTMMTIWCLVFLTGGGESTQIAQTFIGAGP